MATLPVMLFIGVRAGGGKHHTIHSILFIPGPDIQIKGKGPSSCLAEPELCYGPDSDLVA